ncbi:MAG: hypothetical protein IPM35_41190 [Myxococcales bacterium]|nr:hypothetical protein [Myxococcales bacterium]
MARRPSDEQALHDRVIRAIWQQLQDAGRIAETNPGQLRMVSVCGYYPDVMAALVHERTDIVQAIYEVETWSTVEERHAKHQWVAFAGLALPFYLVVPEDCLDEARRIARELDVEVTLVGFAEREDGSISFDSEIVPPL